MVELRKRQRSNAKFEEQKLDEEGRADTIKILYKEDEYEKVSPFISNLYKALEEEANRDVISWSGNGAHFVIYSMENFKNQILPPYFPGTSYATFVRQVSNLASLYLLVEQIRIPQGQHNEGRKHLPPPHLLKGQQVRAKCLNFREMLHTIRRKRKTAEKESIKMGHEIPTDPLSLGAVSKPDDLNKITEDLEKIRRLTKEQHDS